MDAPAIRVWDIDLTPDVPDGLDLAVSGLVTAAERHRAKRLTDPDRGTALLRSHAAVRLLLAGYLGMPVSRIVWRTGRHGKPALTGSDCEWSLSRSGSRALLAVAAVSPVGVDIQTEHPHGDPVALARRFFTPDEAGHIAAAPDGPGRVRRLCRALARKEALAKAAGDRLLRVLRQDVTGPAPKRFNGVVYRIVDLAAGPGVTAAIATTGRDPGPVDYHTCDWRDLCALN